MEKFKAMPFPVSFRTDDDYLLKGFGWRHTEPGAIQRSVVLINPATSVKCRYYWRFAAFLYANGFDVIIYDYRGIGESKPASLKGFEAGWIDWGQLDFEAALRYAAANFPGQPIQVVGHSVGGFLIGLAASSHLIKRVFTVGAQFAYWRDYARHKRVRLFLKWHIFMPALTAIFGYFPGSRLGWLEDTPRGVVRDWTAPYPRFEDNWRYGSLVLPESHRRELVARFAAMRGETLALSLSDDEFGTAEAIRRLLGYFRNSHRIHIHLSPEAINQESIGHFAFFHSRFENSLWKIALEWLQDGCVPPQLEGEAATFTPESHANPDVSLAGSIGWDRGRNNSAFRVRQARIASAEARVGAFFAEFISASRKPLKSKKYFDWRADGQSCV